MRTTGGGHRELRRFAHVAATFSTAAGPIHEAATRYLNWPTHRHK
jgi:hypothetical protein